MTFSKTCAKLYLAQDRAEDFGEKRCEDTLQFE